MRKPDLDLLVRRVISDPVFRARFMVDPEVAISEAGWDLPPDDIAALKEWHATTRDVTKVDELAHSLSQFVVSRNPNCGCD